MKKQNKGITLIALVITIIVLLILAAVTISTLTGDNGILTQAGNAKAETTEGEEEEKIKLGYAEYLIAKESGESEKLKVEGATVTGTDKAWKIKFNKSGTEYEFDGKTVSPSFNPEKVTISEAQTAGTVFEKGTTLEDKYGNQIKIPEGFKIASDSATEVTKGIVIEDATYAGTIGSQFVWIPVGEVTGSVNGVEKTETIKLSRYTFGSDGTPEDKGDNVINSYYQELATSEYGNATAKDIEAFKSSANNNHGYYIGRYEAGIIGYDGLDEENRNWTGTNIQVVCKAGQEVWNYITQPEASEVSKNMYIGNKFTSDLINSYSWDTAIVFIQKFGEESNSGTYSRTAGKSSISTSEPQNTGTDILSATGKVDKQCNIYDLAGNCREWSTETSSDSGNPCVSRGGNFTHGTSNDHTGYQFRYSNYFSESYYSFRPLLYL